MGDDVAANLKALKRQLGACEDQIRMQKQVRKSLIRQIAEAREDSPAAFSAVFPEVIASEARKGT